jgi:hypothetical protein
MRKPNKREIILGGVLVASVFYTVGLDRQVADKRRLNNKFRTARRLPVDEIRGAAPAARIAPGDRVPGARGSTTASQFEYWNTDPFNRTFAMEEFEAVVGRGDEREELELRGILITQRGAAAMIGNRVCRPGEQIDRYVVAAITRHAVVLRSLIDGTRLRLEVK